MEVEATIAFSISQKRLLAYLVIPISNAAVVQYLDRPSETPLAWLRLVSFDSKTCVSLG